ncbi:MAG: sialidase family protein [Planctomycetota bacterium]
MIEKFTISNDPTWYEAWPDVTLTPSGKLVCIFSECTHHGDRSYTRVMLADSDDRGRTWSPKRPLTEGLNKTVDRPDYWNCARIVTLAEGRLVAVVDLVAGHCEGRTRQDNFLWFSDDEGASWDGPHETPVKGIVPDQLIELKKGDHAGRWLLSAHAILDDGGKSLWYERTWLSDDQGATWEGPFVSGHRKDLKLCEGSVVELPDGQLVCFMRENSGRGLDAFKTVSRDGGRTWTDPVEFPLPGCHRPVAGMLQSGHVMITHRFMQGGKGWVGWWTQNFFAGLTDVESCLSETRSGAHTRILPLDFDRSPASDTGYSGWVQFDDGELYVVNYIVDDAEKGQIRGYALREDDFVL